MDNKKNIIFKKNNINKVSIAGDWNNWQPDRFFLTKINDDTFIYPVSEIPKGKHFYKFIIDGNWEAGENRVIYINDNNEIYDPYYFIDSAEIIDLNKIRLKINRGFNKIQNLDFLLNNDIKINNIIILPDIKNLFLSSYEINNEIIKLYFSFNQKKSDKNFNVNINIENWLKSFDENEITIFRTNDDLILQIKKSNLKKYNNQPIFNEILIDENIVQNKSGLFEKKINFIFTESSIVILETTKLDITKLNKIKIINLDEQSLIYELKPSDELFQKNFISQKKLGANYNPANNKTTFRLFSPRASSASLHLYKNFDDKKPFNIFEMKKDDDGVWEFEINENLIGKYYKYTLSGLEGEGEYFNPNWLLSDLYAYANVYHYGKSIVINPDVNDDIFPGWTDNKFKTPEKKDLIIYEASIRDLTADISSKVEEKFRGKYLGLILTENLDTGIGHIKELGINAIEFLPVHEFDDNPPGSYHWGYMTSLFFTPESSYSTAPEKGKQITEYKKLIDILHKNNIAVIMDVVYNHTGSPDYYKGYDNFYYYRLNKYYAYLNYSGCGNDFKTENPMVRKLIIDSLKHFVNHYHIDGFRFDLTELIDLETLFEIENELTKIKPDIILIAEPWSFRGSLKGKLKNRNWSSWNDDFRNTVKDFVKHKLSSLNILCNVISGSTNIWTVNPLETINYVESHDDFTLTDDLSNREDHNGLFCDEKEKAMNRICATILFTSAGIPMIAGGQEFLRSKSGCPNSYNSGDEINSLKYNFKEKNKREYEYYKGLIKFRNSEYGSILKLTKNNNQYYQFYFTDNSYSIGYLINADCSNGKKRILVLINADYSVLANFNINFNDESLWQQISNGEKIDINGINNKIYKSKIEITIEPLTSIIFIEK
ncbi:MAG TPA: alpha-amylase family glycosyl hydrolase [bacterium]|nr:alpha-amylase family glycosyl hydrolase [bacterium]HOL47799.1 alpha-amylase family glycosyl hydrolase [bacterium]HPQ18634.1 alpha-amylase family glycosyl hydrolase [bacterium]